MFAPFFLLTNNKKSTTFKMGDLMNESVRKVLIINPKGGCGKSTIATNLAALYAACGDVPTIMDYDEQQSSMDWLSKRPESLPPIHGVKACRDYKLSTYHLQRQVPRQTQTIIIDAPARPSHEELVDMQRGGISGIVIPLMPSAYDTRALTRALVELLTITKGLAQSPRIGVVLNRVRNRSRATQALMEYVDSISLPLVASFYDRQSFVVSAETGCGIVDMPQSRVTDELLSLYKLATWLREARPHLRADSAMDEHKSSATSAIKKDNVYPLMADR